MLQCDKQAYQCAWIAPPRCHHALPCPSPARFNMREKPSRPTLEFAQQGRITGEAVGLQPGRSLRWARWRALYVTSFFLMVIPACDVLKPGLPGWLALLDHPPCRHLASERQPAADHGRRWPAHGVGPAQRLCRPHQVCGAGCQVGGAAPANLVRGVRTVQLQALPLMRTFHARVLNSADAS